MHIESLYEEEKIKNADLLEKYHTVEKDLNEKIRELDIENYKVEKEMSKAQRQLELESQAKDEAQRNYERVQDQIDTYEERKQEEKAILMEQIEDLKEKLSLKEQQYENYRNNTQEDLIKTKEENMRLETLNETQSKQIEKLTEDLRREKEGRRMDEENLQRMVIYERDKQVEIAREVERYKTKAETAEEQVIMVKKREGEIEDLKRKTFDINRQVQEARLDEREKVMKENR